MSSLHTPQKNHPKYQIYKHQTVVSPLNNSTAKHQQSSSYSYHTSKRKPIFNETPHKNTHQQANFNLVNNSIDTSNFHSKVFSSQPPFIIGDNGPLYDEQIRSKKISLTHSQTIREMQKIINSLENKFQTLQNVQEENQQLKRQLTSLIKQKQSIPPSSYSSSHHFKIHSTQKCQQKIKQVKKMLGQFITNNGCKIQQIIQILQESNQ